MDKISKVLSIGVDEKLHGKLKKESRKRDMNISYLVRTAINNFLKEKRVVE